MIYHITPLDRWGAARSKGCYQADSLSSEGFIHASTRSQILNTASRFYHGQQGLVLLFIDERLIQAEIRYENLEGGSELFPHIYGSLNLDAVVKAAHFDSQANGSFNFPETGELD